MIRKIGGITWVKFELVQQMSRPEGFRKYFEDQLRTAASNTEAYEATELTYEKIFGRRRYSSYTSFATCNKIK